jgi:hypothetical protein
MLGLDVIFWNMKFVTKKVDMPMNTRTRMNLIDHMLLLLLLETGFQQRHNKL